MDSGHTCIRGPGDVLIADYKIIFQIGERWFLRERHGSQRISGTSSGAVDFAQHMNPNNKLSGACAFLKRHRQIGVPIHSCGELSYSVRGLIAFNQGNSISLRYRQKRQRSQA